VRRVLLLNALIFAVLAAAVALAYYGYSYTSEASSRERELALMQDLVEEKVLNIESLIDDADTKLLREVQLDRLEELGELVRPTGAAVASVFVLDDKLELIPGGYWGRPSKEGDELKKYFFARILPELQLPNAPLGIRGHQFLREKSQLGQPAGRWYLFSFMRRMSGDRTFYVVIEDDLTHLVAGLSRSSSRSRTARASTRPSTSSASSCSATRSPRRPRSWWSSARSRSRSTAGCCARRRRTSPTRARSSARSSSTRS